MQLEYKYRRYPIDLSGEGPTFYSIPYPLHTTSSYVYEKS